MNAKTTGETCVCRGCYSFVPDRERPWSAVGTCMATTERRRVLMTLERHCCLRSDAGGRIDVRKASTKLVQQVH